MFRLSIVYLYRQHYIDLLTYNFKLLIVTEEKNQNCITIFLMKNKYYCYYFLFYQ